MRRLAALVCALEAVTLLAFAVYFVWELVQGRSHDTTPAAMSALILVVAVGIAVLARSWLRGADWPNTPTVVWNVLLLPVAWSLLQAGRGLVGVAVGLVALVGVVAAVRARTGQPWSDRS
jgi:hypothetical protein